MPSRLLHDVTSRGLEAAVPLTAAFKGSMSPKAAVKTLVVLLLSWYRLVVGLIPGEPVGNSIGVLLGDEMPYWTTAES